MNWKLLKDNLLKDAGVDKAVLDVEVLAVGKGWNDFDPTAIQTGWNGQ